MVRRVVSLSIAALSLSLIPLVTSGNYGRAAGTSAVQDNAKSHKPAASNETILRQFNAEAQKAYSSGDFQQAEARYKDALKLSPNPSLQIVLLSNLGAVYREQHKYEEAESSFKSALGVAGKNNALSSAAAITVMRQYAVLLRKVHRGEEADALESRAVAATTRPGSFSKNFSSSAPESPAGAFSGSDAAGGFGSSIRRPIAPRSGEDGGAPVSLAEASAKVSAHPELLENWRVLLDKYIDAKDWSNAASTVESMIRRFPSESKKLRSVLAYCYYENGDYQTAISHCRMAVDAEPGNGDNYLRLYQALIGSGDSKEALEVEKQFVERFPSHPKHESMAQHYQYAKADAQIQDEKAAFKNKPLPPERQQSFPLNAMPLKVFINNRYNDSIKLAPNSQVSEDTPSDLIQKTCDAWTEASGNRVKFAMTDRQEEANIEVYLTDDASGLEQGYAQGITEPAQRGENKKRIRICTVERSGGKPLDKGSFLDACLHEFGHALGLQHSGNIQDIMYQSIHEHPLCALSQTDAERITLLYTSGSN